MQFVRLGRKNRLSGSEQGFLTNYSTLLFMDHCKYQKEREGRLGT